MKLFLCGGGSGKQVIDAYKEFEKCIDKNKPILYIPLAMDEEKYNSCYEWFSDEIKNFGGMKFDMVRNSLELSNKDFNKYAAIFIGGGNTFKLLKDLKEHSNWDKIINYLNNDGVIFAGSAGAIVFGKDINSALIDDGNDVNIFDLSGFNYLKDYSILCHLKESHFNKNEEYLKRYSKKFKTIYMPEEDVILISNNEIKMIGNKDIVIFDNDKYCWRTCKQFEIIFK